MHLMNWIVPTAISDLARGNYAYAEVLHQDHRSVEASAHGQERRGVVRVRDRRGLYHRRSVSWVRYWWTSPNGAERRHYYDRLETHCRRWDLTPTGGIGMSQ